MHSRKRGSRSRSKGGRRMGKAFRRFEVLLPLKFNDGQPVPDEWIGEVLVELRQRFGAVSLETQVIRGQWQHEGQTYYDDIARVFLDAPDLPEHSQFFTDLKERPKAKFQQFDIWVVTYPIDVI